jgi:hypothetical protein
MHTKKLRVYVILFFFLSLKGFAQGGGPPPPGDPDPEAFPIDHEIKALMLAGILFGGYVIRCRRK